MNFEELCKDFELRRPKGPVCARKFWFEAKWENGDHSINDLLRIFLKQNGYEYLSTINGDVWFLFDGEWHKCLAEVDGTTVRFHMLYFIPG